MVHSAELDEGAELSLVGDGTIHPVIGLMVQLSSTGRR